MQYETVSTNDNIRLAFQTSLSLNSEQPGSARTNPLAATCILLMHGFAGSSEYFVRNFAALSSKSWVVAPDMRGHGRSQHLNGGYHVARLAADLKTLVSLIQATRSDVKIYPVGCSIGAAVLWTYIEIFGNHSINGDTSGAIASPNTVPTFHGMVFVDQAPLQDRTRFGKWDESKAHYGLYDEKTLLEAQSAWASDDVEQQKEAHRSLVSTCLGYRVQPDIEVHISSEQKENDEAFFTKISAQCNGVWLARLMADHTRYDHREAIEDINVPVLVMVGNKSGCFPIDGMTETVRLVNKNKRIELAKACVFDCGHWLFYEEPDRFNREILGFVDTCQGQSQHV